MGKSIKKKHRAINERIVACDTCSFHDEVKINFPDKKFMPDFCFWEKDEKAKIMEVGLNPGWDDDWEYLRDPKYSFDDYHADVKTLLQKKQDGKASSYQKTVAAVAECVRKNLGIGAPEITAENVYNHVLYANLSWCASNGAADKNRIVQGVNVPCNVYGDEIPTCLGQGYLHDMFNLHEPEVIVFFGKWSTPENTLKEIFGEKFKDDGKPWVGSYLYQERKTGEVCTTATAVKGEYNGRKVRAIFVPHPNSPVKGGLEKKLQMAKDACSHWKPQGAPTVSRCGEKS